MKIHLYEGGGYVSGSVELPGQTLTGPLLLSGEVNSPSEAVHKQYIDTISSNIKATGITTGVLSINRLPVFTGDASTTSGSNVFSLSTTGVINGDYTKVVVDAKGRITLGESLTQSDLPNLSWSKINIDKPTTLGGYGITNALSSLNGTVTGKLTLNDHPVENNDAVTKQYVDENILGEGGINTGDIINRSLSTPIFGYLRCNGGEVNKSLHNGLYGVVGDTYSFSTVPGNGKPWKQQYDINLSQLGDISGWTAGDTLPNTVFGSQALVTKSRVYLLGGIINGSYSNIVYTSALNSDGSLGSWTTATSLPTTISHSQAIVTKSRVYLLGGYVNNAWSSSVYTALINSDGTLGSWSSSGSLPGIIGQSQAVITKNRVYLLGGYNGTSSSSFVYTAPIDSNGSIGTWVTSTALPESLHWSHAIVTRSRVYLLGGQSGTTAKSTIYTAAINEDGTLGTWSSAGNLPATVYAGQAIVSKNQVYLLGGVVNGQSSGANTVYTANINLDGTLGTWSTGTSLNTVYYGAQALVTNNRVIILGGHNGTSYLNTTASAVISGGENDYSDYYLGTLTPTSSDSFRLPDYTQFEKTALYYFIKT